MIFKKNNPKEQDKWKPYKKKKRKVIIRLFLFLLILIIFTSFAIGLHFYRNTLLEFDNKNIQELEGYIKTIKKKTSETSKNLSLARKYNRRWKNATAKQKNNKGINPDAINKVLQSLTKKYDIVKYDFTMSVPKKVEEKEFNGDELDILSSALQISFLITDDAKAVRFLTDLQKELVGYVIVKEFTLRKNKKYQHQHLVTLSEGRTSGLLHTRIAIQWYVTKKIIK